MITKLLLEMKNILADLASTLITGRHADAADLAMRLSEELCNEV
jgi:hypothetical protein